MKKARLLSREVLLENPRIASLDGKCFRMFVGLVLHADSKGVVEEVTLYASSFLQGFRPSEIEATLSDLQDLELLERVDDDAGCSVRILWGSL